MRRPFLIMCFVFMCSVSSASDTQVNITEIREFDFDKTAAYDQTTNWLSKIKIDNTIYDRENYKIDTLLIKDCDNNDIKIILSTFEVNRMFRWFSFMVRKQNRLEPLGYSSKPISRSDFLKLKLNLKNKNWSATNFWGCDY